MNWNCFEIFLNLFWHCFEIVWYADHMSLLATRIWQVTTKINIWNVNTNLNCPQKNLIRHISYMVTTWNVKGSILNRDNRWNKDTFVTFYKAIERHNYATPILLWHNIKNICLRNTSGTVSVPNTFSTAPTINVCQI